MTKASHKYLKLRKERLEIDLKVAVINCDKKKIEKIESALTKIDEKIEFREKVFGKK